MPDIGDYFVMMGGSLALTVNPHQITPNHSIKINEKLTDARINATIYAKIPPLDGELKADWIKRYNEEIKKENKQLEEETAADFIRRAIGDSGFKDNLEYMYNCLKGIADVFGQENKVNRDLFYNTPVVQMNNFIANVCQKAKVPCPYKVEAEPLEY